MSKGEPTPRWGELFRDSDPTPRQRLPYGAVPLDPWGVIHHHDSEDPSYWNASIDRIREKFQAAIKDQEWLARDLRGDTLQTIMYDALFHSHYMRLERNSRTKLKQLTDPNDPRVELAWAGTATPAELFTLLADHPELGSLELAKLSHPFDFDEPYEMDDAMAELMLCLAEKREDSPVGELLSSDARFKVKRIDEGLPAAVVLRKQDLMDYPCENGSVRIIKRQGFLVFEGKGAENEVYFDRLLKNPKNWRALGAKVEWYLGENPKGQLEGWVQPQATSYYAKHIPVQPVVI